MDTNIFSVPGQVPAQTVEVGEANAELSGEPVIITTEAEDGTPYYHKAYPAKSA
jgi:hypothetical protein